MIRNDADQLRLTVRPSPANGLRELSQLAIDKITVVPRDRIGGVTGEANHTPLLQINRALALFLSIV